jgi:DHA1 family tetracycline resistance protein-like MFS transporter
MDPMNAERKKHPIFPIFVTVFIDLLGFGIAIPTLAVVLLKPDAGVLPFATPFGIRTIFYGLLVASYPLAQFFGAPILGALSDRYGRKRVLIAPIAANMLGYIIFALGLIYQQLHLLFLARIIDGFAGGSISIAMSALADISEDDRAKTRNFGLIGLAFGLGFILGPFIGGKLSDPSVVSWFRYDTPFWFAAFLCLINMILVFWRFPETLETRSKTPVSALTGFRNLARAFTMTNLRTMFLVVFLLTLGFNFFTQFFQVFLIEKFSFTQSQIGDLFAYVGLWIAISQGFVTRPLSRKFAPRTILSFSALFLGLTLPLLVLPEASWVLFFILPFIAMFQGLTEPNSTALVSELSDASSQGEILGIKQSIQSMGMAIPPIVAGFISGIHHTLPILVASIITLLAWGTFVRFFRPEVKQKFSDVA